MYQIDSMKVEDYLNSMDNLLDEMETIILSMKDFEEKLVWDSVAGQENKEIYKSIMSYEEEVCDILNIFMLIYEKGLASYNMTLEELQREFEELLNEHNIIGEEVL
jgi:hypothetical protein